MRLRLLVLGAALAACSPGTSAVPPRVAVEQARGLPMMRQPQPHQAAPPSRGNAEMAQDILDLTFLLESGRELPVLSRFEGPVRVAVAPGAPATLAPDLDALLMRLRDEAGLDIAMSDDGAAEIVVVPVPQAALVAAVPNAACFVVPGIGAWDEYLARRGTAALDWAMLERRGRAAIFLPADASPQEVRDCLHEELAQAVGPLGDLYRLPDSVFNDDNIHAVLTGFDMLALRALNDPALASGMTREEVAARLPAILARLNPAGERVVAQAGGDTPRDWVEAVETALSGARPAESRRVAAEAAVAMSRARGWTGVRTGFSEYALGRTRSATDPDAALAAFEAASESYAASPVTSIHRAHVDVQLAAFALASGDMARVLTLARAAGPIAEAHENAALLATLLMFEAEASEALGDDRGARALRLDSLAWARYGFGPDAAALGRLAEVQSLNPLRRSGGRLHEAGTPTP